MSNVGGRLGLIRMTGRDAEQSHRVASPLELFFDLVFVVAVSQASQNLHHGIAEGHAADSVLSYVMVFFAIWWAWMNFTWFASAFDTDDWLYRVMTIVQMGGVLVLASGVHDAMVEGRWELVTWGYVIMRLAMVGQWLRLAVSDPEQRPVAIRYAVGITCVQAIWVARIALSAEVQFWTFFPAMLLELLVPFLAERARKTPWHPHHIAERYSLFTLIVLGESLLASSNAIIDAQNSGNSHEGLATLAVAGIVLAAGMWWLYFSLDQGERLRSSQASFFFGYAHYFVFAAAGAVSAGIEVELDLLTHSADHLSASAASLALTIPVTVFLLGVWVVLLRSRLTAVSSVLFLASAGFVLASAAFPTATILGTAVGVIFAVAVTERHRVQEREANRS